MANFLKKSNASTSIYAYGEILYEQYKTSCRICGTYPDYEIAQNFMSGIITLNINKLDIISLQPICHAIGQVISPYEIDIKGNSGSGINALKTSKLLHKLINSLISCLAKSETLLSLKIMNIRIPAVSVTSLCKGLSKPKKLQCLCFENCYLKDSGIEQVCRAIKNVPTILSLTFDNCSFGALGGNAISSMIKHQSFNRTSLSWQNTLRDQKIDLNAVKGIEQINLSNNPTLGDAGAEAIANALLDDIWIAEIIMKNCGLTEAFIKPMENLVKSNQRIEVFDVSNNPFLSDKFALEKQMLLSKRVTLKHQSSSVTLTSPIMHEAYLKDTDGNEKVFNIPSQVWPQHGMPYRVEQRILERRENLPAGSLLKVVKDLKRLRPLRKCLKASGFSLNLNHIRKVVGYYEKRLSNAKKRRKKANLKYKRLERKCFRQEQKLKEMFVLSESEMTRIERTLQSFESLIDGLKGLGMFEMVLENGLLDRRFQSSLSELNRPGEDDCRSDRRSLTSNSSSDKDVAEALREKNLSRSDSIVDTSSKSGYQSVRKAQNGKKATINYLEKRTLTKKDKRKSVNEATFNYLEKSTQTIKDQRTGGNEATTPDVMGSLSFGVEKSQKDLRAFNGRLNRDLDLTENPSSVDNSTKSDKKPSFVNKTLSVRSKQRDESNRNEDYRSDPKFDSDSSGKEDSYMMKLPKHSSIFTDHPPSTPLEEKTKDVKNLDKLSHNAPSEVEYVNDFEKSFSISASSDECDESNMSF